MNGLMHASGGVRAGVVGRVAAIMIGVVGLLLGAVMAGVGGAGSAGGVERESALRAPSDWPERIVLGLVPSEGGSNIEERYRPMAEHLRRVLGIEVEVMSGSDYSAVVTAMTHKHVDVAYFGPKSYVEAAARADAVAVAMELSPEGEPGYHGLIVARKDRGAASVQDVKGKTFAFTDPNSTSGYLVPLMHFKRDLKTDPKAFFREVRFAGSHQASILAVLNGSVDAAATNDLDLARVLASGQARADELTILWKSELIPGAPMAVRRDLPESLKAAITGALMSLGDDRETCKHMGNGGYVYANDASFDVMRYLMKLRDESGAKDK